MEEFYSEKKKRKKSIVFNVIIVIFLIAVFYILNFFNINPPYTIKLINHGNMKSATYSRDFIFTIIPKINNGEIPEFEVVFNETTNTAMSESLQDISLIIGGDSFEWRKLYKFDTLIEKTPYDVRYFKFDNYKNYGYSYNYKKTKSLLLNSSINEIIGDDTNVLFSTRKFEKKKVRISTYEKDINDKVNLEYEINFGAEDATKIFEKVYSNIWNSEEFKSFFREDNDIQQKIRIENHTKKVIDILDNIKKNLTINGLNIKIVLNKDYPESIVFDFEADYIDSNSKTTINIGLSEYLKAMGNEYSPEEAFDIVSVTPIEDLTGGDKIAK